MGFGAQDQIWERARSAGCLLGGRAKPAYWAKSGGCQRSAYWKATFLDQLAREINFSLFICPDAR